MSELFKGNIYSIKSPVERVLKIFSYVIFFYIAFCLSLTLFYNNSEISNSVFLRSIFYGMLVPFGIWGTLLTYDYIHLLTKISKTELFTINHSTILFRSLDIKRAELKKMTIRIREIRLGKWKNENNYLKIETFNNIYEFGLILDSNEQMELLKSAVARLKSNNFNVIFENFLK